MPGLFSGLPYNAELSRITIWWTDFDAGINAPISLINSCVPFDGPVSGGYQVTLVATNRLQAVSAVNDRFAYADVNYDQITDTKECTYLLQFGVENAPMKSLQRAS